MSNINPDGKQLLLTLSVSVVIEREAFLRDGPLTQDMIGVNWVAERLFLAHQETDNRVSYHKLPKTQIEIIIVETYSQIIIQTR